MSIKSLKAAIDKASDVLAWHTQQYGLAAGTTEAARVKLRECKAKYQAYLAKKAEQNKAARAAKKLKAEELAKKLAEATAKAPKKVKRTIPQTREEWLMLAVDELRPIFTARGYTIPEKTKVSIGFPSAGARGKAIGECWHHTSSAKGFHEIFLTPLMVDQARILGVLVHELGHAAVGCEHGHRAPFKKFCAKIGLEGNVTSAVTPDAELSSTFTKIVKKIGDLPHAALSLTDRPTKKQGTRMIKCHCNACEAIWRTSRKTLTAKTALYCPDGECGGELVWAIDEDESGEEE